jgi:hypothetical protein
MDPALGHIATEAKRGVPQPPVSILAAGVLYVGHLGTEAQVVERMKYGLGESTFDATQPRKREAKATAEAAITHADEIIDPLLPHLAENAVLTLLNCQVWFPAGEGGLSVAAVRISQAAVDAWWIGGQKRISGKNSGGGIFVGGVLTVEDAS